MLLKKKLIILLLLISVTYLQQAMHQVQINDKPEVKEILQSAIEVNDIRQLYKLLESPGLILLDKKAKNESLYFALEVRNIDAVLALLNFDANLDGIVKATKFDINRVDDDGNSLLMLASVKYGYSKVVNFLIAQFADVGIKNKVGSTAFMLAAEAGDLESAIALKNAGACLDEQDTIGNSALTIVSNLGHIKFLNFLIENGVVIDRQNVDGCTALAAATADDKLDAVICLIKAKATVDLRTNEGATPFLLAAENGHFESTCALALAGADVNAQNDIGDSAILFASRLGDLELVKFLLKRKVDVNLQNYDLCSAIGVAALKGEFFILKSLLEAKAVVDSQDCYGFTALWSASSRGLLSLVDILIKAKANVDFSTDGGTTPLMVAALQSGELGYNREQDADHTKVIDYLGVCKALVRAGARFDSFGKEALSAYDIALLASKPDRKVINFLAGLSYSRALRMRFNRCGSPIVESFKEI